MRFMRFTLAHCWPSCTGRGLWKAGSWLLAAKCSNPFPNVSWLKLSKLVINSTKAPRCAEYHISANFKLHIQTCSYPNFSTKCHLTHVHTQGSCIHTSALFSLHWLDRISLQHQHTKHALSRNTLPIRSPGTNTNAWTQSKHNCCRCHHSKFKDLRGGMAQHHTLSPPPPLSWANATACAAN